MAKTKWQTGDFFAFVAESDGDGSSGDILYGRVLGVSWRAKTGYFAVEVWCRRGGQVGELEDYVEESLTYRISPRTFRRARALDWPESPFWLRSVADTELMSNTHA